MEIKQDLETGKILLQFESWEKLDNDFSCYAEDYIHGLTEVISNNIGPDVVQLKNEIKNLKNSLNELIPVIVYQQLEITALTTSITGLIAEIKENPQKAKAAIKAITKPAANKKTRIALDGEYIQRLVSDDLQEIEESDRSIEYPARAPNTLEIPRQA